MDAALPDAVVAEISTSDLVVTAVGANNLPDVAPVIASALRRAASRGGGPRDVVVIENQLDPGNSLRREVARLLPADFPLDRFGFASGLVSRVVARREGDPDGDEPLVFVGDSAGGMLVEAKPLRGSLPELACLRSTVDYEAAVRRKLYTFSAAHAAAAYLGRLKGYHYVHTAVCDPDVAQAVAGVLREGLAGLRVRFGDDGTSEDRLVEETLSRFRAPLDDAVSRVGRDPRRKLAPDDRIVGAAVLAAMAGIQPVWLALTYAAAVMFPVPSPDGGGGARSLAAAGVAPVLRDVSGIAPEGSFGRLVTRMHAALRGWRGDLLAALDPRVAHEWWCAA